MIRWIIIHWFELSTLGLLCLNLWFVATVLKVLRSVNHWLTFLAAWFDRTQPDSQTGSGPGS